MPSPETCALCGRPLGARHERHHLVPRAFGGAEVVELHPICHRKIHSVLTERELAAQYHTIERLLEHPEIKSFVRWISRRPPDFHKRTRRSKRRGEPPRVTNPR